MFPAPTPVRRVLCDLCRTHWVRGDRLIGGLYGTDCATKLGLLGATGGAEQTGPDLFDAAVEEEDRCDGWDR